MISVLEVKYDDNIPYDRPTSGIAIAGCLGNIFFGTQGKPQISYVIVS
jgi:hypothetical protein